MPRRTPPFSEAPTKIFAALANERPPPLGEWLVGRGLLSRYQLLTALMAAHRHGCRLGDAIVWLDFLPRPELEDEVRLQLHFSAPTPSLPDE